MSEAKKYGWSDGSEVKLLVKLKQDLKTAMLCKDNGVRDTIRQVISEFPKLTMPLVLESGKKTTRLKKDDEISNDDILGIISGLVKSEKMVLELKKEDSSEYLEVLEQYLPKMADRETVKAWIEENVDLSALKSPMQGMGPIMKHFGKSADGSMVKAILHELIG